MMEPDRGCPGAEPTPDIRAGNRMWKQTVGRVVFAVMALSMAYLTLVPNNGRVRFRIVPLPLYRWLAAPEHDWLVNIIAFGFLAAVVFLVGGNSGTRNGDLFPEIFGRRGVRLVVLLMLVCGIETAQIWIPGRTSSLEDVCTGWSGIFAAWLLSLLLEARAGQAGRK